MQMNMNIFFLVTSRFKGLAIHFYSDHEDTLKLCIEMCVFTGKDMTGVAALKNGLLKELNL